MPTQTVDAWRDLSPWDKARLRWMLQTSLHPSDPRPNQVTPPGDWLIWLLLAGRGWGKTRTGVEDVSDYARTHPGHRIAGVFATYEDGRDVGVEGNGGLLSVVPDEAIESWNRSLGELIFTNGARFDIYSAEKPSSLRGPEHHRAWCDELAKWRYLETWDQLMFGLRLGVNPQCVVTTTPKPLGLIRDIIGRETTIITRGSTFDNARNLAPAALAELRARYEGSQLGRQELYAELLDDFDGALWRRDNIDHVIGDQVPELARVAIGIDPSGFSPELGDTPKELAAGKETGLVVVGITRGETPEVFILEDESGSWTGETWGSKAVALYRKWSQRAPTVLVPEMNLAGPLVLATIRLIDPDVRFYRTNDKIGVRAAHGKRARAEPVATLYEQGRAHHVGRFAELEDQMCSWDPSENWSPDRIDALVWAVTALEPWKRRQSMTSGRTVADTRI